MRTMRDRITGEELDFDRQQGGTLAEEEAYQLGLEQLLENTEAVYAVYEHGVTTMLATSLASGDIRRIRRSMFIDMDNYITSLGGLSQWQN